LTTLSIKMKLVPLHYLFLSGLLFIVFHIVVEYSKLNDTWNLLLSVGGMLIVQYVVYYLLKREQGSEINYMPLFMSLAIVQTIIIILLSLNSAFNPLVENKPMNVKEILFSLVAFAVVFPGIVAAVFLLVHNKFLR
jgi:hypothetical protein